MFESYQQQRTHRSVSVGAHLGKRVVSEMEFCDPATSLSGCHALCVCPHCCATPMHTTDTSPEAATSAWLPYWGFQVMSLIFKVRTEREGIVPPHRTWDPIFCLWSKLATHSVNDHFYEKCVNNYSYWLTQCSIFNFQKFFFKYNFLHFPQHQCSIFQKHHSGQVDLGFRI